MARGYLVLEDGTKYEGELFGSESGTVGEVVFATGMSGYQETLVDPACRGQVVVMTYPLIGNYGVAEEYFDEREVHARGIVVREYCRDPSPMYDGRTIDEFLKAKGTPGISGIDTREIVLRIRSAGTMRGAIVGGDADLDKVVADLAGMEFPCETNLVSEVTCGSIEEIRSGKDVTVGIIDCGAREWLVRTLSERFDVVRFPYDTPVDVIGGYGVDGIVVSDGPGNPSNPEIASTVVATVSALAKGGMPVFGIGFGGLATVLAMGGSVRKLKFGHNGASQPVKYNGRVHITTQNHCFTVEEGSLDGTGLVADQVNVNDGTIEGTHHESLPILTVQYHPEAAPGPWDGSQIYDRFARMIEEGRF